MLIPSEWAQNELLLIIISRGHGGLTYIIIPELPYMPYIITKDNTRRVELSVDARALPILALGRKGGKGHELVSYIFFTKSSL